MPNGKPAGVRCVQLSAENRCLLFGKPERPAFCVGLKASPDMCGETSAQAFEYLISLEHITLPIR